MDSAFFTDIGIVESGRLVLREARVDFARLTGLGVACRHVF